MAAPPRLLKFANHRLQTAFSRTSLPVQSARCINARAAEYLPDLPDLTESQRTVREAISKVCTNFPDEYWLDCDNNKRWPSEFTSAITKDGWLGICMPAEYGGSDLGLAEAVAMMQTIAESGGGFSATSSIHMNIFGLAPVVKYGTEEQKKRFLPPLIEGKDTACFAVTEPNTGLDTLKLQSTATLSPDSSHYLLHGSKTWTSTAQRATKILILPNHQTNQTDSPQGRAAVDTNTLHFSDWRVPADDLIGGAGGGFGAIMHGMNAERVLLAGEAVGLGFAALRRAAAYARGRVVFGRPVGANQGVQHPLAASWCELEAARLMVNRAAAMYDAGCATGEYANAVKYLAAEAAFRACERAVMAHGGMGYAREYHVERYLREVLVPRIAPVSREMCLNYVGEKVLRLPKSY
ncbi:hypothetical protein SLS56_004702 [Neofusicoccum ribis]|uniref:Acyl-CoA dehydrogenase n=1 Tax=Neofusicoccum ribis TaxID=45134 RepID=A0ABR3SWI0_9PEZI